jgi:trehalose 6-phosphate synthase/phosphatase
MRLLVVSNRAPVTASVREGKIRVRKSAGGLATGVGSYLERRRIAEEQNALWVGWPGIVVDNSMKRGVEDLLLSEHGVWPVFLTKEQIALYYEGLCNETIWPLFHYFPTYASYSDKNWQEYKRVNELFCEAVIEKASPGDTIWVHDYHLMLLPALIRQRLPDSPIGFFLHIPFPSFETFRLMPRRWRSEILDGLIGADLIGFHTQEYTQNFLRCVLKITGCEHSLGEIHCDGRVVKADTFPMGIDYQKYSSAANLAPVQRRYHRLKENLGSVKVVLSIDRLDYTKGIASRLRSFKAFLEENPQWHERVALVLVVVPSRTRVGDYRRMKSVIDTLVGEINGRFGHLGWTPILYQYRSLPLNELVAHYLLGDVALITPKRDGMNLIAKEYLAVRNDGSGALILSEMAGAACELGEAILVNPGHVEEMSGAIAQALEMPADEQVRRIGAMQERLQRYDIVRWAEDFLESLEKIKNKQNSLRAKLIGPEDRQKLLCDFRVAKRRLLALDYDGTLVPLDQTPELAQPTVETYELLEKLARLPGTCVAVISGRDRETFNGWFGAMDISLIAEHGAWIRKKGTEWKTVATVALDWKDAILPLLERSVDRLPGSFIEVKDYSLAWHYRRAESELGALRSKELKDDLIEYTANMNLRVLQGSKVIEVRHSGVDKGRALIDMIDDEEYDFVLAIGDDWTDEDFFNALPETAYTMRVGTATSMARFHLERQDEVVSLLKELARLTFAGNSMDMTGSSISSNPDSIK